MLFCMEETRIRMDCLLKNAIMTTATITIINNKTVKTVHNFVQIKYAWKQWKKLIAIKAQIKMSTVTETKGNIHKTCMFTDRTAVITKSARVSQNRKYAKNLMIISQLAIWRLTPKGNMSISIFAVGIMIMFQNRRSISIKLLIIIMRDMITKGMIIMITKGMIIMITRDMIIMITRDMITMMEKENT